LDPVAPVPATGVDQSKILASRSVEAIARASELEVIRWTALELLGLITGQSPSPPRRTRRYDAPE
jgi:hypothetical protein